MNLFIENIFNIDKAGSSNDAVKELVANTGLTGGVAVLVKNQTNGRGQKGNKWLSEVGKNLTFSILVNPAIKPQNQFYLSKYVAITCFRFISEYCENVKIKWPNDIYVNNKKIAGILIENNIQEGFVKQSVIGIGININQKKFDNNINATSFTLENNDKNYDILKLFNLFVEKFNDNLSFFHNYRLLDAVYHNNLYLINKPHIFTTPAGEKFEGIIKGTSQAGNLQVYINGNIKEFGLKEIIF